MTGLPPDYTIIARDSVGSTNDEAAALFAKGTSSRTVVTAKTQTKGRGRYGRNWTSEDGNLFASIILTPPGETFQWGQIGFVISLAIAEALQRFLPTNAKVQLKWPNDVLVNDKKIAGVLLEIKQNGQGKDGLILGFGVNCASHPEGTDLPATNLAAEGSETHAPEAVLEAVLVNFDRYYELWKEKGFAAVRPGWLALAKDINKEITVRFAGKDIKGIFADIGSDDGALYIKGADDAVERISAGDVHFGTAT
jgi:BirA family biotin operon repressor/biotin-[acetyl-CoA-carboxylase] ligase